MILGNVSELLKLFSPLELSFLFSLPSSQHLEGLLERILHLFVAYFCLLVFFV